MDGAAYSARAPKVVRKQSAGFTSPPVGEDLFLHSDVFAVCHAPRVPYRTRQKPFAGFTAGYPPIENPFAAPDWHPQPSQTTTWTVAL